MFLNAESMSYDSDKIYRETTDDHYSHEVRRDWRNHARLILQMEFKQETRKMIWEIDGNILSKLLEELHTRLCKHRRWSFDVRNTGLPRRGLEWHIQSVSKWEKTTRCTVQ